MRALHGIGFATLLTGCPLLEVDVEMQEVCITRRGVEIEGVTETSFSRGFVFDDLSDIHELLEHDADLRFVRARIRAASGVSGLGFVDSAAVSFENTPVYSCDGDCPTLDNEIELAAGVQTNAVDYLAQDSIAVQLEVSGELPATAWSVDVDVCVRGHIKYAVEP